VDANEDRGTHGTFDNRASDCSPQLWADLHRNWIAAGLLALGALALGGFFTRRQLSSD
jgi:hypothetical protein